MTFPAPVSDDIVTTLRPAEAWIFIGLKGHIGHWFVHADLMRAFESEGWTSFKTVLFHLVRKLEGTGYAIEKRAGGRYLRMVKR